MRFRGLGAFGPRREKKSLRGEKVVDPGAVFAYNSSSPLGGGPKRNAKAKGLTPRETEASRGSGDDPLRKALTISGSSGASTRRRCPGV